MIGWSFEGKRERGQILGTGRTGDPICIAAIVISAPAECGAEVPGCEAARGLRFATDVARRD